MSWSDYLPTLRDRDQWVVWGYRCRERDCGTVVPPDADACPECGEDKTKPPLAPFDGRIYAKSDVPDTWRSFDEAVAYHDRDDTDTQGIGFMLSAGDTLVGVDLDGCRHPETGDLEPWAEDIIDRLDTYAEVSPSGTGVRLFVVGILPDGRRKQKQERTLELPEWVVDEKNAEVEVYQKTRYMTYTGDHLEGTPDDVEERAETLREIHAEYVAEDDDQEVSPHGEKANPSDVDLDDLEDDDGDTEELTNELGESLSSIRERDDKLDDLLTDLEPAYSLPNDDDSPSGYDMAAASKLYFWRFSDRDIARILRRHRPREKTRSRTDYLERTVANAKGGEQYDPDGGSTDSDPMKAVDDLENLLTRYEGTDDDPGGEQQRRMMNLLADVPEEEFADLRGRVAVVTDTDADALARHRTLARHRAEHGPIRVESGKTWYLAGTPLRRYELLNFELEVQSFLNNPDDSGQSARIELHTPTGGVVEKTISPRVFKKQQRWEDDVQGDRFGLTMNVPGPASHPDDLLDDLNRWVMGRDAPTLQGARHLGLHGDEWVLPDGSLSPDGWLDDPTTVYLEREIEAERRVRLSPDDGAEYDEADVRAILRDLPTTRNVERFLPVLGWFYAASFRPWILEWEGEFNLLSVTGGTGSGKTTTLGYLNRCFGLDAEPLSVDTYFATMTSFASSNALPVWFDEYKPSDMGKSKREYFHRFLRKTTKGQKEQRGRADGSTVTHTIAAPVVVSGEQKIQGTAERRRSIMTTFRQDVTDPDTDTYQTYKRLAGQATLDDSGELELPDDAPDPTAHALAWYRWVTGRDRDDLRERWHAAREFVAEARSEWATDHDLDELEVQGLQTVVFGWRLYRSFADDMGVRLAALPDDDDLRAALRSVADASAPTGSRKNHEDTFVELLSRAASAGYLERGTHYDHVKEGSVREELRFNVGRCYDTVSKYVRDHGLDGTDLLGVDDYRERFSDRADEDGHYVRKFSQNTPGLGRCVGISTIEAMNALEYDPHAFDREEPVGGEVEVPESDDGGDGDGDTDSDAPAAADGGAAVDDAVPDDAEGTRADAERVEHALRNAGAVEGGETALSTPEVASRVDLPPDRVRDLLQSVCRTERGTVAKGHGDEWRLRD